MAIPFFDKTTGTPKETSCTSSISPSRYVLTVRILWLSVIIVEIKFEIANDGPYSVAPFLLIIVFPAFFKRLSNLLTSTSTDLTKYFNGIPPIVVELKRGTI